MTELQETTTTDLSIRQDQHGFNDMQVAALKQLGVQANNPADIQVFFHQAKATGLDPFKREIYMITRKGKPTIQTGIDGFYKIADRVSRATGGTWGISETLWCGPDGQWADVWLQSGPPSAAKVTVERNGAKFTTVAVFSEYQAEGPLWQKMPARMIAKCAEALAIRKAFPDSLSGLYTSEEMEQADNPAPQHRPRRVAQPARGGGQLPPPEQSEAPSQGIDWEDALSTATSQPEVAHLVSLMKQEGVPSDDPAMRVARDVWRNLPAQAPEDTGEIVEQEG